ncbi:hypothetical protein N9N67_12145 [Bacteriovoracaceae bacterium]|nr:hypothetical protein [Bacteriovoracaceae bacterium]
MKILNFGIAELHLPLKVNWKLSRNETTEKVNLILCLEYQGRHFFGEVAFNVRYGETFKNSFDQFHLFSRKLEKQSLSEGLLLLKEADINNSLKCGFEQCLLKAICLEQRISVHEFFSLAKPEPISTFFTIPIMPLEQIPLYYKNNNLDRYKGIKLKVNRTDAYNLIKKTCSNLGPSQQLLVDANEAFESGQELIDLMMTVKDMPILCFEQPFPKELHEENLKVTEKKIFPLMADESIEDIAHFDHLKSGFDYINVKTMKTGGLVRAVEIIKEAKEHNLKVMMGCMIETSLSMSYSWEISSLVDIFDFDGPLLLKKDPYEFMIPEYLDLESF